MERLARLVIDRAALVLAGVAVLALLAAASLVDPRDGSLRLGLDPSLNRLLPEDDPAREFYDHVRRLFGSDETVLVALVDDDVFTARNLRALERMTERLTALPGVHHVVSLSSAVDIRSEDGDLVIEPFVSRVPDDRESLDRLRREALANPIYAGNLVAKDAGAAALLVYLKDMTELEFVEGGTEEGIRRVAEEESGGAEVWITGGPWVKAAVTRVLLRDLVTMLPLAFALVAVVALVSFRTLRGVLVPGGTIAVALVWTLGTMAALGLQLNLVTTIVPILIVTVGFAYAVHLMGDYYGLLRGGECEPESAARRTLADVALPVLLTGVTTAVGFASLALSPLGAIREFGGMAVLGVLYTALATLTFAPALLQVLPPPRRIRSVPGGTRVDRAARRLGHFDLRNRGAILLGGVAVAAVAVFGLTRIRVGNEVVTNFAPGHPVRTHFEAINEHLEGANGFYVVIETGVRDSFKQPENLRTLRSLQDWLEVQPEIGGTTSLADYVKLINRGFHAGDPEHFEIPDSKRLISQLLFFGANDDLESFVDSRYQTVSVLVRSRVIDSTDMRTLIDRIEERLETLPPPMQPTVTGNSVLIARTVDELSRGQAVSLSTAFLGIYLLLALLFTSFRVGFIALIPNALPVLAYFGILGLSGVTLNATTGLVACMVLGIAVDDTIHFLARFNHEAKRLADERAGVVEALRRVARPITTTTVALCLGLLVLTLSTLRNQAEFGVLAAVTLAFAWVVDVTLTPALTSGMRIVSLWDTLTLDLGVDPHKSIPLFRGLSKRQARIAALMMRIHEVPAGERLCSRGEAGDEMYVVIEGKLAASVVHDDAVVPIRTMERGDVVGEVALFEGRRTADVDVVDDARLLALTQQDLERLPRRYPRIAANVFRNLSDILAGRLASSTARLR